MVSFNAGIILRCVVFVGLFNRITGIMRYPYNELTLILCLPIDVGCCKLRMEKYISERNAVIKNERVGVALALTIAVKD